MSGHERNRFFLSDSGESFEDVSGISGLDGVADGRAFALFDYDRDGWQDVVLVNSNAPLVELFRNRIADDPAREAARNRTLALRFEGGNRSAQATPELSNRDGIGARVEVEVGATKLTREQRAGEGLAAQNSSTMLIGVGAAEKVDRLVVHWPSGITRELRDVPTGQLIIAYELEEHSPAGQAFAVAPRPAARSAALSAGPPLQPPRRVFPLHPRSPAASGPRLVLYATMATWCATCQAEIPHWARLTELFSAEELEIRAVPVDNADTPEKLARYIARHEPAYTMLSGLSAADVAKVNALVVAELGKDGLPASFVTDAAGQILESGWGAPTVSRLRELLSERSGTSPSPTLAAVEARDPG